MIVRNELEKKDMICHRGPVPTFDGFTFYSKVLRSEYIQMVQNVIGYLNQAVRAFRTARQQWRTEVWLMSIDFWGKKKHTQIQRYIHT